MNASLPPDDGRQEVPRDDIQQDPPVQAASGVGWGTILGSLLVVVVVVLLVLPGLQIRRGPAPRSKHAEMQQREQAIEQAAREADDEDGLADHR